VKQLKFWTCNYCGDIGTSMLCNTCSRVISSDEITLIKEKSPEFYSVLVEEIELLGLNVFFYDKTQKLYIQDGIGHDEITQGDLSFSTYDIYDIESIHDMSDFLFYLEESSILI